jgi:hypothetical protein
VRTCLEKINKKKTEYLPITITIQHILLTENTEIPEKHEEMKVIYP